MGQVQVVMTGDEARLFKSLAKVIAQEQKMAAGFGEIKKKGKQAGDEIKKVTTETNTLGDYAASKLGGVATGFLSVGAAVSAVTKAMQELAAARNAAGDRLEQSVADLGELFQLSENADELVENARKIFRGGGAKTLGEAAKIEFAIQSAGVPELRDELTEMGKTGLFRDVAGLLESVAAVQTAFGEGEAGSFRDIISKGLAGSEAAPGTVPQLLEAVTRAAAPASKLGLTDEETIAATAVLAKTYKSADVAATYLSSLLEGFAEQGMEGKGLTLAEMVSKTGEGKPDYNELKELLGGRVEAMRAFSVLSQSPELYTDALSGVRGGQESDELAKRLSAAGRNTIIQSVAQEQKQKGKSEDIQTQLGELSNLADAVREANVEYGFRQFGDGFVGQMHAMLARAGDPILRGVVGDEAALRQQLAQIDTIGDKQLAADVRAALERASQSMERAAARIEEATKQKPRTPPQPSRRAAQLQERNAQRE